MYLLPIRRDAQVFVEKSTQEFRVLLVVRTTDLANTVKGAECTGVSLSSKHHHLVRVDMHSNVLVRQRHKTDVSPQWEAQTWHFSKIDWSESCFEDCLNKLIHLILKLCPNVFRSVLWQMGIYLPVNRFSVLIWHLRLSTIWLPSSLSGHVALELALFIQYRLTYHWL